MAITDQVFTGKRSFQVQTKKTLANPLMENVMDDPVTLASGYSVDQTYYQWFVSQKNTCPVSGHSLPHSISVPNHLLRDMIAAWCLDHSKLAPSTTADILSVPWIPPSEEQIQVILEKLSGSSGPPKETLHLIQLMSKTSKGVQPCLEKWPDLAAVLLDLKKKWKLLWTPDLEEERITIILNLSMHRPNREILAEQRKLPGVLLKVIEKADSLGSSASLLAMVASIIFLLSEFGMFRKKMLDIRGMKMLRDLLKIEDVVVRKESGTAILALCTDEEGKTLAEDYNVADTLLECFMVTDEFLLLLERLPKSPHALDKICDRAVEWVNIIMGEHASGMVTSRGIHSAISLISIIAERDVGKLKVKNLEDFKERLRELTSKRMPMQTMFLVDRIMKTLSEMFPAHSQLQN
ncbi:U-box domain-containing protein 73 isoform X4 [Brachypodium distachyon]|uniref:U-box domain-containing protein 73 isoform X4 n=1 Tax=Brachypodium distachyon TaxID=15368 RepID=UPI00071CE6FA|nr:U-box domain-containing protein 73 isoform X4 [Brachypodium distachyon]|eukprot:XP_014755749.1 U-box domain-containing protein 73 isoform X4 [Brachypodium distachyon]